MRGTVLVTGATGSLGPAVVRAFEAGGAQVVQAARSLGHDLSDPATARALADEAGELAAVAHLVGGYAGGQPVAETPLEAFRDHWELHVATAYNVVRAAIPRLAADGAIVLFSSRAAVRPFAGAAGYASAKAAEIALAQAVDAEGARCNVVAPVEITDPEAIADVVTWLCSPASRAVRGQVIVV